MSLRPALSAALLLLVIGPLGVPHAAAAADGPMCDGHPATIVASPEDDVVHGTPGDDVIVGSSEAERIEAGPGNDVICAGDGWDKVFGGAGDDRIFDRGKIAATPAAAVRTASCRACVRTTSSADAVTTS